MAVKRKLSDAQRAEIKARYATGASKRGLAIAFDVSQPTIAAVLDPAKRKAQRAVQDKLSRAKLRAQGLPTPMQRYRAANLEACRQAWAEWYAKNRDVKLQYGAEYARKHPEVFRAALLRRRAGGRITAPTFRYVLKHSGGRCSYCGLPSAALEVDHIVPVAAGGGHDLANLAAACRSCNARKGTRPLESFLRELKSTLAKPSTLNQTTSESNTT